ncbi:hypothetical protein ACJX0J_028152, partial [Zea mays]
MEHAGDSNVVDPQNNGLMRLLCLSLIIEGFSMVMHDIWMKNKTWHLLILQLDVKNDFFARWLDMQDSILNLYFLIYLYKGEMLHYYFLGITRGCISSEQNFQYLYATITDHMITLSTGGLSTNTEYKSLANATLEKHVIFYQEINVVGKYINRISLWLSWLRINLLYRKCLFVVPYLQIMMHHFHYFFHILSWKNINWNCHFGSRR